MQQERGAFLLILFKAGQRFEESAMCLRPASGLKSRRCVEGRAVVCRVGGMFKTGLCYAAAAAYSDL